MPFPRLVNRRLGDGENLLNWSRLWVPDEHLIEWKAQDLVYLSGLNIGGFIHLTF